MTNYDVCLVGASAGGLQALTQFLKTIPLDSGMTVFVIQHLSPDHESAMDELLAPHVKLPLMYVTDGCLLEPNIIYLCPPGVIPRSGGQSVYLSPRVQGADLVLPINNYLKGLAHSMLDQSVAVILSGTGSDGSEGAQEMRNCGGYVFVQDPADAQFSGMPQSAISTGAVDGVARADRLWELIVQRKEIRQKQSQKIESPGTLGHSEVIHDPNIEEYAPLLKYLNRSCGLNFKDYKIASIGRRVERRMQLLSLGSLSEYTRYLEQSEDETRSLYCDLLIGVTRFFRDQSAFEELAKKGLKAALKNNDSNEFRIWVAGCATGEEAYSLYILASEIKESLGYKGCIRMFATDIFKPSIEIASRGIYSLSQLEPVSEARRLNFFKEFSPAIYKIRPEVRENIVFAPHNFLENAPFTRMDLVVCRNVLIYLVPSAQETALQSFTYALKEGGLLFLGASENMGKLEGAYKTISSKEKLYKKQNGVLDSKRWATSHAMIGKLPNTTLQKNRSVGAVTISRDLLAAYDALLERSATSGFLCNSEGEVLHYFGKGADFFTRPSGRADSDNLGQLASDLRPAVMALLNKAGSQHVSVMAGCDRRQEAHGTEAANIRVCPLGEKRDNGQVFLVEIETLSAKPSLVDESAQSLRVELPDSSEVVDQVKILEDELRSTRESLESANEELQVSFEELQATNEEMQVSYEEIQSTNEELYSLNEELTTLNHEYERKNRELIAINVLHQQLLESTEDGVLFVDGSVCIQNYNTAIASAFNLLPSDIGRPLEHIAYNFQNGHELVAQVHRVISSNERYEEEVTDNQGRSYLKRIVPFKGLDDLIEGALLSFTDVTQFHALNQRFNFAIESVGISWWEMDLRTGKMKVNSSGACILGINCAEGPRDREGWMRWVHPDDRANVESSLNRCLAGEVEVWNCEHRFKDVHGEWLWVKNVGRVMLRGSNGESLEMIGTTQDIDPYKRALFRSNRQRELLEAAGAIANVGYWEYDLDKERIIWSKQTRDILEVDASFEPSAEATYKLMDTEDRGRLQQAFDALLENGQSYDLELKFFTGRGRPILARSAGSPIYDSEGKMVRVIGVFQDITDVTKTQHQMKAYFSMSPDFQATLNLEARFQSFSASWTQFFGYSDTELTGMKVCELMHPDYVEAFRALIQRVLDGEVVDNYETKVVLKSSENQGEADWMSWSLSSDALLGLIFVSARRVTEQKKQQNELELARIRAEDANRAKSDFLAVMSHELRTPLNPVLGFAELLLSETTNPETREILQTIIESANHMTQMVSEILDFSKLDAAKSKIDPVEFALSDFIQSKVKLMRGQIKGKPIKLYSEFDPGPYKGKDLPYFKSDVSLLGQICRNLIGNAIKFTEKGEICFAVKILSVEHDDALIQFEVRDTGIGIPDAFRDKVFEPFTQADSSTTRAYEGTGLGLSICKRLVTLLKGEISFESSPGKGSTFRFTIPVKVQDYCETLPEIDNAQKQIEKFDRAPNVLVVEDNASNAFLLDRILNQIGCKHLVASSGEEALSVLEKDTFDLVMLDLHMPGVGGLVTLDRIRNMESEGQLAPLKIIIITADADENTRTLCMAKGADYFIKKPVIVSELRAAISKLLYEPELASS